jgi:hypothetical protein
MYLLLAYFCHYEVLSQHQGLARPTMQDTKAEEVDDTQSYIF